MNKNSKKVALKFATFAALFGVMSFFMEKMEQTEEQTTYSVTLESLALGNGETDGENGGTGGGGADGESDGGTTTRNGYDDVVTTRISQEEIKDVSECLVKVRTRGGVYTTCKGQGTLPCTPGFSDLAPWSSWKLKLKEDCQ